MRTNSKSTGNKIRRTKVVNKNGIDKSAIVSLLVACLSVSIFVIFSFWMGKQIYDIRSKAATTGWVENDRSVIKASAWMKEHAYADCSDTNLGFWATSRGDCLFKEPSSGPTAEDLLIAKDPPGLYYKHFLPTDFYRTIPTLLLNVSFNGITKQSLEATLQGAIQKNPTAYANLSVDSLNLGLEGGNGGTKVRSASIWVHPTFERPISNAIGVLQRAKNLYKPFIEGATGGVISDADLSELYTAALNRCGDSSINGDQSGRGVNIVIGDYIVVVQHWDSRLTSNIGITNDCNIHVVSLSAGSISVSPPPPQVITPTFACLGCTPTSTPVVAPTTVEDPTVTVSPPPRSTPGSSKGLIEILLAFIQLIISFFTSIFSGSHQ